MGPYPRETNASDGTAKHIGNNGRIRIGRREVGMELGTVPMGDAWHDDAFNVGHDILPFLGLLGRGFGQQWSQVARFDRRQNTSVPW